MTTDVLKPRIDLLQQEYVLVQAWKKTASYIRYHNWFSDTLELDRTAVNLPMFIAEIAECLQSPDQWKRCPAHRTGTEESAMACFTDIGCLGAKREGRDRSPIKAACSRESQGSGRRNSAHVMPRQSS